MIDPASSVANLRRLAGIGLEGEYGLFDAIDYSNHDPEATTQTGPVNGVIVRSYLAHHEGMTLVALANALLADRMVERFHTDPRVQATELLLQERVPRQTPTIEPRPPGPMRVAAPDLAVPVRRFRSGQTFFPHAQFLSNGNYIAVVTNAGGGSSFCRGLAITRSRHDPTRDPGGQFIYLRDVRSGTVWSATSNPTPQAPQDPRHPAIWPFHALSLEGRTQGSVEWETDRARFLGRGRSTDRPIALDGRALSGTTGVVLDPIVSLRQRIRLLPGGTVRLCFATGVAPDRETAEALAQKYHAPSATSRTFALAFTHAQSGLRHLGISAD